MTQTLALTGASADQAKAAGLSDTLAAPSCDAAAPPPSASARHATDAVHGALIESRQRWRDLVMIASDLVFETDAAGRFVFLSPDTLLGWPSATLIGQSSEALLAGTTGGGMANPFRPLAPIRRRRAWLKRADGGTACFSVSAAPLLDSQGIITGARGVGQDVSEEDQRETRMAATLRRAEVLDHILWRMRQEVLAPRMMQSALEALAGAMGAEGAAVIDLLGDGARAEVLHAIGAGTEAILATTLSLLDNDGSDPADGVTPEGRQVLACPSENRFGERFGLVAWRAPGGRAWDEDEPLLAAAATGIVRVILEHESIQREMARQARTDPLTGLFNRRAFLDEVGRRIDRLDREGAPGTLMFLDLDHFKELNDQRGHDVGDDALCITAALLRATVRPADLVARFGGDEFAMWLDGADELAAAERAETLRIEGPRSLAHLATLGATPVTMSIGIATRWPAVPEDIDQLIQRADQVMYEVKRAGRAQWRVARASATA
jgi:diguanylate cyclase (GGDEF)-like protein/PAS domain S-box-containing protein